MERDIKAFYGLGGYGYNGKLAELRKKEFSRLDKGEVKEGNAVGGKDVLTYLDHAGATLYGEHQLNEAVKAMQSQTFANPHSQSTTSQRTTKQIELARKLILDHVNADASKYSVIFCAGATAGLKLLGECFPFDSEGSEFCYSLDNHNSVLGIREYAHAAGASVRVIDDREPGSTLYYKTNDSKRRRKLDEESNSSVCLFAFPGESNFSGRKLDLGLAKKIKLDRLWNRKQNARWFVCLDGAKMCATDTLDLKKYPEIDFVAISAYKIIGYPTGLGALIVKNSAGNILKKRYFGGGTVEASVSDGDFWQERKDLSERLEDGTVSFLSIISLRHGFDLLTQLGGMIAVRAHVRECGAYLYARMLNLKHANGRPLCEIYGYPSPLKSTERLMDTIERLVKSDAHGGIVSCNLKDEQGQYMGYSAVEKLAGVFGIQIRTGCFCNPGACQTHLGLSKEAIKKNLKAGHVCWDTNDVIDGIPTGAIRVSLGFMTTLQEIDRWIEFLKTNFINQTKLSSPTKQKLVSRPCKLSRIIIYPIKSCTGYEVEKWPLSRTGLMYDRHWAIVNVKGVALSQKRCSKLSLIHPKIDLISGRLELHADGYQPLVVPLHQENESKQSKEVRVCSSKCSSTLVNQQTTGEWLTQVLGQRCSLVRMRDVRHLKKPIRSQTPKQRSTKKELRRRRLSGPGPDLSFVNEGQYLLVNQSSVDVVASRLTKEKDGTEFKSEEKPVDAKNATCSSTSSCLTKRSLKTSHNVISYKRFRPNFVVSGAEAFAEDEWNRLAIMSPSQLADDKISKKIAEMEITGPCVRCYMVDIDETTGEKGNHALLRELAKFRKKSNQIVFGVLLHHSLKISPVASATGANVIVSIGNVIDPVIID
mmetsp:Transcript_6688/g.10225  ORF Transcript_6688/g.10225 Transcript_6688/m.10225 type:complete len:873 (-) Transcript_6688:43-2661(-)